MPRTTMHRTATVSAVVAGLLAIPAVASAHPAFNPNELPPGEAVESTLVVPHGCAPGGGMPGDGEAEPTVELALQHTDGVTVEPGDVEGWDVTDDGQAWVWSDAGGATTDVIELPVTITVDQDVTAGAEIYLRAFQECADGSAFQWIGTPDQEASFPAVLLATSEGEVGTTEPAEDMDMNMDHGDTAADQDMEMSGDGATAADEEAPAEEVTAEDGDDVTAEGGEEAVAETGGLSTSVIVLIAVVLLAAVVGLAVRARSS